MAEHRHRSIADRLFLAACIVILIFLIAPTLLVIPMSLGDAAYIQVIPGSMSLRWYRAYFSDPDWRAATLFSLKIATLTMVAATIVGSTAAIALTRADFRGRDLIRSLALTPLIAPHVIVALALYLQFAPLKLTGSTLGFVLAHTVLAAPYVMLIVSAALAKVDPALEMAALGLGAGRIRSYLEITLPLIRPAIAAGAVFAFLASFDETVVSFFLSGIDNKTITRKIFEDIDFNLTPVVAAVSTIFMAATIGLALLARLVRGAGRVEDATQPAR